MAGRQHWWLQTPSVLVLGAVVLFPLIYSANLSLRHYNPTLPDATGGWVGLANYARLLHDSQFGHALLVTVIFVVAAVGLETVLGTLLGIFLDRLVTARRIVTSVLLLPMIATPLVVGLVFSFALNPDFGYLTWFLKTIGLSSAQSLLANPASALTVLILVDVWEWVPFVALMALAGLRALPTSPIEAARIDGCSPVQVYTHIILPMLRPVLGVAILFRATEAVREFDKVYVLTGGGPGASTTVNDLFQYRVSFTSFDLSYGAALGLVTFVFMLIVTALTFRTITRSATS
jgi:multiple sugar transport system permease protein